MLLDFNPEHIRETMQLWRLAATSKELESDQPDSLPLSAEVLLRFQHIGRGWLDILRASVTAPDDDDEIRALHCEIYWFCHWAKEEQEKRLKPSAD